MPPYLVELHRLIEKWSYLGVRSYGDGTKLVGHLSRLGVHAYLHRLFGPLTDDEVEAYENRIQQPLHPSLKEFYEHHNGCMLFGNFICVFGVRRSYDRADFDAMACNPFDGFVPTIVNRDKSLSGRGVVLCTYEDQSLIFLEPDGVVHRIFEGKPTPANVWGDLGDWLISEYVRLELLFDEEGVCQVAAVDTVPPSFIS
jgi:hypothetical protein